MQLLIGGWQSFNLFFETPTYGWWLSTAAIGLHLSAGLHNVIAWMKIRPFLSRRAGFYFIGALLLVQPYWILEIYATFAYFNNVNEWLFPRTRPIETAFRDPWWVAGCAKLLWVIKSHYALTFREVITISPRFAVMLASMALSLAFVLLDILSVTHVLSDALPLGVNPFWKLALVFKCLTDTVILDDFKTALDRLWAFRRTSLAGPRAHDPVASDYYAHNGTASSSGGYARGGPTSGTGTKMGAHDRFGAVPGPASPDPAVGSPGQQRRNTARDLDVDLAAFSFKPGRNSRTPELNEYELQPPAPSRGVVIVTSTWETAVESAREARDSQRNTTIIE